MLDICSDICKYQLIPSHTLFSYLQITIIIYFTIFTSIYVIGLNSATEHGTGIINVNQLNKC